MLNNEEKINVDIMQDASEIVRYDETGIPLYIQTGELSRYPDRKHCATGTMTWNLSELYMVR